MIEGRHRVGGEGACKCENCETRRAAARATIGVLTSSDVAGVALRTRLELEGRRRRSELARGRDRDVEELEAEINRQRDAAGLPALELERQREAVAAEKNVLTGNAGASAGGDVPALSLLESLGITDPSKGVKALHLGTENPYLAAIEEETAAYRIARAARLRMRAASILALERPPPLPDRLEEGTPAPPAPALTFAETRAAEAAAAARQAASEGLPAPAMPLGGWLDGDDAAEWVAWKAKLQRRARWHLSRAKGSLERFPRVRDCGDDTIVATCVRGCGVERRAPAHCGVGRLCLSCRARCARRRKERFNLARELALTGLRSAGVLQGSRYGRVPHGGQWSEKFMTLTIPHVGAGEVVGAREACDARGIGEDAIARARARLETNPEDLDAAAELASAQTCAARILLLLGAWRAFSLRLQRWGRAVEKKCGKRAAIKWYRAFEWTPGDDGLGHPHFHLWIVCPFLPKDLIEEWWRAALESAGLEHYDGPIITDIREWAMPGSDRANELLKSHRSIRLETAVEYIEGWSIVDTIDGQRIAPATVARVYEALDEKRLVQASTGLLEPVIHCCPFCGADSCVEVKIERPDPTAAARADRPRTDTS